MGYGVRLASKRFANFGGAPASIENEQFAVAFYSFDCRCRIASHTGGDDAPTADYGPEDR